MKTDNYSKFQVHELNRKINRTNIERLKKSMLKYGYIEAYPIHVKKKGNKFLITAGHHRFVAASELRIPLHYVVIDFDCDIFVLEGSTRSWKSSDYIDAYAKAGYEEYIQLIEFADANGINRYIAARLLSNIITMDGGAGTRLKERIAGGKFKRTSKEFADRVVNILNKCESAGVAFAKVSPFISAVAACCKVDDFSDDMFISHVKRTPKMMVNRGDRDGYLEEIERVYVYGISHKNKIPLAFTAKNLAKSRSVSVH